MKVSVGKGLGAMPDAATITVSMTLQEARELVTDDEHGRARLVWLMAELQMYVDLADQRRQEG